MLLKAEAVLSLLHRTMYAMLVLSVNVVPLPRGHEGAEATSSVARIAVCWPVASEGVPAADVTMDLTGLVSLVVVVASWALSLRDCTL